MQLLYQFQLQFINDLHSIPHKSNFIANDEIQIEFYQKRNFEVNNKAKKIIMIEIQRTQIFCEFHFSCKVEPIFNEFNLTSRQIVCSFCFEAW